MTCKERFLSAIHFKRPDMPALEYYYTDVGYAEHGEKLQKLYLRYPGDAAPVPSFDVMEMPKPEPGDIDRDGNYLRTEIDEWGTKWEYRIFGRIGCAVEFPLDDWDKLDDYLFPPVFISDPANFTAFQKQAQETGSKYPVRYGIPGLLDRMIALRPFQDVLVDLIQESPELIRLADILTERYTSEVKRALAAGTDIICIGDDYGTGQSLLVSPEIWRKIIHPRLSQIIEPIKNAGKTCCFHSCGYIWDILPDLKRAGADSIWPQLPLYDYRSMASALRELKLSLCIHIDRGELMQHGKPDDVRAEVERVFQAFRPDEGGSWFYFEVDQGFPFENIKALAEAIAVYRK
jgi:uroporphyrinogen decarboxylase